MANISNLQSNERLDVKRPNLRESLQSKMKIEKIKRRNPLISKGKYENRQNCKWCEILNRRAITKLANFWNFDSFLIWKILKFSNLGNYKNLYFEKLANFPNDYNWVI